MRRSAIGVFLACVGCGPPLASTEEAADEVESSSESTDAESSGSGSDETTSDSTSSESSDSTESETGPIECEPVYEGDVVLDANTSQATLDSLDCVEHITGDLHLEETTVGDLEFLSSLVRVDGYLGLLHNQQLIDLQGLHALEYVGGRVTLIDNDALVDLRGLESLRELAGLRVVGNSSLVSLDGLEGDWVLHAADRKAREIPIDIRENISLASLDALADVTSVDADLPLDIELRDNPVLVGDLSGLASFALDGLYFTEHNNPLESLTGLEALTHARQITLHGPASQYTSLAGLDNLVTVDSWLTIGLCDGPDEVNTDGGTPYNHHHLASLDGLESLEYAYMLHVWGNLVLTDIDALAGLQNAYEVNISDNPMLSQVAAESLIANVDVFGSTSVFGNGNGVEPICGMGPPP